MPGTFFVVSLGCPKNVSDLEVISGSLLEAGYSLTLDPGRADIYLVNTCAFIPAARQEAETEIERAITWKAEKPHRKLVISGCLGAYDQDGAYRRKYPQVDFWLGIDDIARVPEVLSGGKVSRGAKYLCNENTPRLQLTVPHLAYLKIADGCNNCCTYCAIPKLRGALRSRPQASVVAEARQRVALGVKELIVVAQDVSAYGMDRPESGDSLAKLLAELNRIEGDFAIRLLYTHPAHYSDELIGAIATLDKVLPYIDIPLQHISDPILRAMNRKVSAAEIEALLKKMRREIPNLVLRSTFITGFPGEGEKEFAELAAFCRRMKFERLGVFPFSPEPGTPAAKLRNRVPVEIAEERATCLMKRQIARMKRLQKLRVGKVEKVLIDEVSGGVAYGRSWCDAPEIDNLVILLPDGRRWKAGDRAEVEIIGVQNCDVIARPRQKRSKALCK